MAAAGQAPPGAAGMACGGSGAVPKSPTSPAVPSRCPPTRAVALPPWHLPEHGAGSGSRSHGVPRAEPPPRQPRRPGCAAPLSQGGFAQHQQDLVQPPRERHCWDVIPGSNNPLTGARGALEADPVGGGRLRAQCREPPPPCGCCQGFSAVLPGEAGGWGPVGVSSCGARSHSHPRGSRPFLLHRGAGGLLRPSPGRAPPSTQWAPGPERACRARAAACPRRPCGRLPGAGAGACRQGRAGRGAGCPWCSWRCPALALWWGAREVWLLPLPPAGAPGWQRFPVISPRLRAAIPHRLHYLGENET